MVDTAVEKLHVEDDIFFLGHRSDLAQCFGAILHSGFAVDPATLPQGVEATHINLNDQTLEGIRHQGHRAFSVQYHPEASAGPHDSSYLFGEFVSLMGATAV